MSTIIDATKHCFVVVFQFCHMSENKTPTVINVQKSGMPFVPLGATIITLLLVIAGSVGLILFQVPLLSQSRDDRGSASVSDGEITITSSPSTDSKLKLNERAKIDVNINTHNKHISEVELVFNVVTNVAEEVEIQTYSTYQLQVMQQEIEKTSDGFLLSYKAKPSQGTTFINNAPQAILSLVFTPKNSGTFKLAFDTEKSKAITDSSDRLRTVGTLEYVTYNPNTTKACNETCDDNADCGNNHRCYENRCRLVTNVSSTSCAIADTNTRQCNQVCGSNSDCANDHVCYSNRCRRADNPDSTVCALSSTAQQEEIRKSCNQPCTDNRGCYNNLRCYQGHCRLATNVSSTSCSAMTQKTVSAQYYAPVVSKGGSPKGGEIDDISVKVSPTPSIRPRISPTPTASNSATLSGTLSPFPTLKPTSTPVITPLPDSVTNSGGFFNTFSSRFGSLMTMIGLGIGGIILALALLFLLSRLFGRRSTSSNTAASKNQTYEKELQKKIDELKQQNSKSTTIASLGTQPPAATLVSNPPRATLPTPVVKPSLPAAPPMTQLPPAPRPIAPQIMPAAPVANLPPQMSSSANLPPASTLRPITAYKPISTLPTAAPFKPPQAISRPPSQVVPQPSQAIARPPSPRPSTTPTTVFEPNRSSMLDRIKQRGITTPGNPPAATPTQSLPPSPPKSK